jgi:hypothetical protein
MAYLMTGPAALALAHGLWLKAPRQTAARLILPSSLDHRGSLGAEATPIPATRNQT